ncbi:MAG: hypothetical protein V4447_03960 [Pseudomonadota bacterium]
MNKKFFKQFAIAIILFLLGYFTFNSKLFDAGQKPSPAVQASVEVSK